MLFRLRGRCNRQSSHGKDSAVGVLQVPGVDLTKPSVSCAAASEYFHEANLILNKQVRGSEPLSETSSSSVAACFVDLSKLLVAGTFFEASTSTLRIADALRYVAAHKAELGSVRQITFLCTPILNLKDGKTNGVKFVEQELWPALQQVVEAEAASGATRAGETVDETLQRKVALISLFQLLGKLLDDVVAAQRVQRDASRFVIESVPAAKKGRNDERGRAAPDEQGVASHTMPLEKLVHMLHAASSALCALRRVNVLLDVSDCPPIIHACHTAEQLATGGEGFTHECCAAATRAFRPEMIGYIVNSLEVAQQSMSSPRRAADVNAVLFEALKLQRVDEIRVIAGAVLPMMPTALATDDVKSLIAAVQMFVRVKAKVPGALTKDMSGQLVSALRPRLFHITESRGRLTHTECSTLISFLSRLEVPIPADVTGLLCARFTRNIRLASPPQMLPLVQGLSRLATLHPEGADRFLTAVPSVLVVLDAVVAHLEQSQEHDHEHPSKRPHGAAPTVNEVAVLLEALTTLRYPHVVAFFVSHERLFEAAVADVEQCMSHAQGCAAPSATSALTSYHALVSALAEFAQEALTTTLEEEDILQRALRMRDRLLIASVSEAAVGNLTAKEVVLLLEQLITRGDGERAEAASTKRGSRKKASEDLQLGDEEVLEDDDDLSSPITQSLDAPIATVVETASVCDLSALMRHVVKVSATANGYETGALCRGTGILLHRRRISHDDAAAALKALVAHADVVAEQTTARDIQSIFQAAAMVGESVVFPTVWKRLGEVAQGLSFPQLTRLVRRIHSVIPRADDCSPTHLEGVSVALIVATNAVYEAVLKAIQSGSTLSLQPLHDYAVMALSLSQVERALHPLLEAATPAAAKLTAQQLGSPSAPVGEGENEDDELDVEVARNATILEEDDDDELSILSSVDPKLQCEITHHSALLFNTFVEIGETVCEMLDNDARIVGRHSNLRGPSDLQPRSVVMLLQAFVNVGVEHSSMFYDLLPLIKQLSPELTPLEVSLVLNAYATLGVWNARVMSRLTADMVGKVGLCDLRQCCAILQGLQRSGFLAKRDMCVSWQTEQKRNSNGETGRGAPSVGTSRLSDTDQLVQLAWHAVQQMGRLAHGAGDANLKRVHGAVEASMEELTKAVSVLNFFDDPPQPIFSTYVGLALDSISTKAGAVTQSASASTASAALLIASCVSKLPSLASKVQIASTVAEVLDKLLGDSDSSGEALVFGDLCAEALHYRAVFMILYGVPPPTDAVAAVMMGAVMHSFSSASTVSKLSRALHAALSYQCAVLPQGYSGALGEANALRLQRIANFDATAVAVLQAAVVNRRAFHEVKGSGDTVPSGTESHYQLLAQFCQKDDAVLLIEAVTIACSLESSVHVSLAQLLLPPAVGVLHQKVQRGSNTADEKCALILGLAVRATTSGQRLSEAFDSDGVFSGSEALVLKLMRQERHVSVHGAVSIMLAAVFLKRWQQQATFGALAASGSLKENELLQKALSTIESLNVAVTMAIRVLLTSLGKPDTSGRMLLEVYRMTTIGEGAIPRLLAESLCEVRDPRGAASGVRGTPEMCDAANLLVERLVTLLRKMKQHSVQLGSPWLGDPHIGDVVRCLADAVGESLLGTNEEELKSLLLMQRGGSVQR